MQGLVKELFELEKCWMRGDKSNRWLFAAMGIAVQMAQLSAYLNCKNQDLSVQTAILSRDFSDTMQFLFKPN